MAVLFGATSLQAIYRRLMTQLAGRSRASSPLSAALVPQPITAAVINRYLEIKGRWLL